MNNMFLFFLLLALFLPVTHTHAEEFISSQCNPLTVNDAIAEQSVVNSDGLLWRVSRDENDLGYVFGTIHVSDEAVTTLPEAVDQALIDSKQFAMEALPEPQALISFSRMMFFDNESRLEDYVDQAILERTREILARYNVTAEVVSLMKPWSAFLTMNYPADAGLPLDLVLLKKATEAGAATHGLETMQEQADIFDSLSLDEQARLLIDTVCHYDIVEEDFNAMKSFYLEQDLGGLYNYVNRYSTMEEPLYKKLMHRLIDKRNKHMVERMLPLLGKGDAFIAIGAMHLPGEKGVLALLEQQGYHLSAIY